MTAADNINTKGERLFVPKPHLHVVHAPAAPRLQLFPRRHVLDDLERDVEVLPVADGVGAHVLDLHEGVHAREALGGDGTDVALDLILDGHCDRLLRRLVAEERLLELQEPVFIEERPHRHLDGAARTVAQGAPGGGVGVAGELGLEVGGFLFGSRSGDASAMKPFRVQ